MYLIEVKDQAGNWIETVSRSTIEKAQTFMQFKIKKGFQVWLTVLDFNRVSTFDTPFG